jgi:hypothetical protein
MKSKNKYNEKPSAAWSPNLTLKSVAIIALSWLRISNICWRHKKLWRLNTQNLLGTGVAGGANFNFTAVQQNDQVHFSKAFHDGFGTGLFIAPLLEYRPADSRWGIMFTSL